MHLVVAAVVGFLSTFMTDLHARGADRINDAVVAALVLLTGDALGLLTRHRREEPTPAIGERARNDSPALPGGIPNEDVTHAMRRNL